MRVYVCGVLKVSGWIVTLLLMLLLPTYHVTLRAQAGDGMATIEGTVRDPDAKVIVSAAVIARNEATGETRTTTTDATGHFAFAGVTPGLYALEVAVPGFEMVRRTGIRATPGKPEGLSIDLSVANITETVTVSVALPAAAVAAPSQGSLTARSAESLISNEYIRNYTSPFSDYSQVLQMAPGTFSVSANGPGLSDTKTFFRGFSDGQYSMTFDGIPFNDTNDPTHHSWVFFPAQTIGSTVFDRSPGSAASIGPSTYGGSVNMLSRSLTPEMQLNGTVSYGSFNTRLFDVEFDSGRRGAGGRSRLMIEAHNMQSDGYQTYNFQDRTAFSAKYQYAVSDNTVVTAFSSVMQLNSNTPNQKGATRAQIQQFGDNFLMSADPTSPLYYKFNFYSIPTNFEYVGVKTNLGHGWSIDDKVYTMRYYNKQNYNGVTTISATSATDKLNSYWKWGNYLPLSHVSDVGVFRTGLWTEYASTDRYQTPSDPRTWIDAPLPNFHEMFGTTTPSALCGIRLEGCAQPDHHAGHQARVLQTGLHAVRGQRQDRRQPQRGGVGAACRRLPLVAAVARHPLPGSAVLVGVRPVRQGAEHPADEHLRREGRARLDHAEADPDGNRPVRFGLEVEPGHARRGRLPHQLSEQLLVDDRPGLGRYVVLSQPDVCDTRGRSGKHHPRRRRLRRLPEWHHGQREVHGYESLGPERAQRHGDARA